MASCPNCPIAALHAARQTEVQEHRPHGASDKLVIGGDAHAIFDLAQDAVFVCGHGRLAVPDAGDLNAVLEYLRVHGSSHVKADGLFQLQRLPYLTHHPHTACGRKPRVQGDREPAGHFFHDEMELVHLAEGVAGVVFAASARAWIVKWSLAATTGHACVIEDAAFIAAAADAGSRE
jgi:hypothetical protein